MVSITKNTPKLLHFGVHTDFYLHILYNDKYLLYFFLYLRGKTMVSIENVNKIIVARGGLEFLTYFKPLKGAHNIRIFQHIVYGFIVCIQ